MVSSTRGPGFRPPFFPFPSKTKGSSPSPRSPLSASIPSGASPLSRAAQGLLHAGAERKPSRVGELPHQLRGLTGVVFVELLRLPGQHGHRLFHLRLVKGRHSVAG